MHKHIFNYKGMLCVMQSSMAHSQSGGRSSEIGWLEDGGGVSLQKEVGVKFHLMEFRHFLQALKSL